MALRSKAGLYTENDDDSDSDTNPDTQLNSPFKVPPHKPRINGIERELNILKQTAGIDSPPADLPRSPADSTSDDVDNETLMVAKAKPKTKQVIQGMCEVVEVRIDNQRPAEIQVTEADFLDEEASGDDDWTGDNDADEGYAW